MASDRTFNLQIGTVCGRHFTNKAASLVCQQMGYMQAESWKVGNKWEIQQSFPVLVENIECGHNVTSLSKCNFFPKSGDSFCTHEIDVFLKCDIGEGKRLYNYELIDTSAINGCKKVADVLMEGQNNGDYHRNTFIFYNNDVFIYVNWHSNIRRICFTCTGIVGTYSLSQLIINTLLQLLVL